MNNLSIFKKKVELIAEINFSNDLLSELKKKIVEYILSEKLSGIDVLNPLDFDKKYADIINLVNTNAPVKIISKNKSKEEINLIFNEIFKEIGKIDLQSKIDSLESKVSLNLDEKLYSELLNLRNQLKSG